ncbi:MAG: hypothetical protein ACREXX_20055 [Gammaproteobacteria bacterium]
MTTLAPDIEPTILDETVPPDLRLIDLAVYPPAIWEEESAMGGTWKRAVCAILGATVMLVVSAAGPYNLNDGFSLGQAIVLRVPGLDKTEALDNTDPVPIGRIGRFAEPHGPIVLIDAHTGERAPIFVEIDFNATEPQSTALMIQPATNLASGHRYIVALRELRDADGNTIRAPEGFRHYRDRLPSRRAPIERRRSHFEGIFDTLRRAGIQRSDLYLAWDFTVASDENIARRVLSMRDDAFGQLGDHDLSDLTVGGTHRRSR